MLLSKPILKVTIKGVVNKIPYMLGCWSRSWSFPLWYKDGSGGQQPATKHHQLQLCGCRSITLVKAEHLMTFCVSIKTSSTYPSWWPAGCSSSARTVEWEFADCDGLVITWTNRCEKKQSCHDREESAMVMVVRLKALFQLADEARDSFQQWGGLKMFSPLKGLFSWIQHQFKNV